jgi:hypothetical protein
MARFGRITYKENLQRFYSLSSALEAAGFRAPVRDIRDFNLSYCRKLKLNEVRVISNDDIFISNFVKIILFFFQNLRGGHKRAQ